MKLIVVATLTVTIIAGIIGVAHWIFGAAVAGIIGLALAGIATKVYEELYKVFHEKYNTNVYHLDNYNIWILIAGILIIQASTIISKSANRFVILLNHGEVPIVWWYILLIMFLNLVGFAVCGYVVGRIVKERVIMITSIGLIILFSIHVIDVVYIRGEELLNMAKTIADTSGMDNETVLALRFGAIIGFIPKAFISLSASVLGRKHSGA